MTSEYIEFQLYDYVEDHEDVDINKRKVKEFVIHSFGRCENTEDKYKEGKSVYMKIKNFQPYFYALIPNDFQNNTRNDITNKFVYPFITFLRKKLKYNVNIEYNLEYEKKADHFENGKKYWFIRLILGL